MRRRVRVSGLSLKMARGRRPNPHPTPHPHRHGEMPTAKRVERSTPRKSPVRAAAVTVPRWLCRTLVLLSMVSVAVASLNEERRSSPPSKPNSPSRPPFPPPLPEPSSSLPPTPPCPAPLLPLPPPPPRPLPPNLPLLFPLPSSLLEPTRPSREKRRLFEDAEWYAGRIADLPDEWIDTYFQLVRTYDGGCGRGERGLTQYNKNLWPKAMRACGGGLGDAFAFDLSGVWCSDHNLVIRCKKYSKRAAAAPGLPAPYIDLETLERIHALDKQRAENDEGTCQWEVGHTAGPNGERHWCIMVRKDIAKYMSPPPPPPLPPPPAPPFCGNFVKDEGVQAAPSKPHLLGSSVCCSGTPPLRTGGTLLTSYFLPAAPSTLCACLPADSAAGSDSAGQLLLTS